MKREDMAAAAKFRATCETCGKRQPRATTQWSVVRWMDEHEREHRAGTSTPPDVTTPEESA